MSEENEPYTLKISERARDALERLDKSTAERIVKKLIWLAENADSITHGALTGQWTGYFRHRVGNYRIIYIINHEARVIDVALVGRRREIYES